MIHIKRIRSSSLTAKHDSTLTFDETLAVFSPSCDKVSCRPDATQETGTKGENWPRTAFPFCLKLPVSHNETQDSKHLDGHNVNSVQRKQDSAPAK
jgi:hypothetical protein